MLKKGMKKNKKKWKKRNHKVSCHLDFFVTAITAFESFSQTMKQWHTFTYNYTVKNETEQKKSVADSENVGLNESEPTLSAVSQPRRTIVFYAE